MFASPNLYSILQHMVSSGGACSSGHVSICDLIKLYFMGAKVNFEYAINNRSLPFDGFITRILSILEFQLMSPHLTPQRKWG